MLKRIALAAAMTLFATGVSAACSQPSIGNGHTVMKFGSSAHSTGAMGTKSSLGSDNRQAGTVYYDSGSGSLKLCNGSEWVDALGRLSSPTPTGYLKPGQWHKKWWTDIQNLSPYQLKVIDSGTYKFRLDVARVNKRCHFYIHEGGGTKRKILWVDDSENSKGGARVVWSIYGRGGNSYRFFVDSFDADKWTSTHRKYDGYQAHLRGGNPTNTGSIWHESGSFVSQWNGKFSWDGTGGCDARIILLRVE